MRTVGCGVPWVYEVGIGNFSTRSGVQLRRVPEFYLKIQATAPGIWFVTDAAAEPDEECPR